MIQPGEFYLADFPGAGRHPVIIVSRELFNRGNYALVVVCTSARFAIRRTLPNCVPFQAGQFGLTKACVAQCESIFPIEKTNLELETGPIGRLDDMTMRDVIKAIGYVIESDCERL